jgi:hypothetical protein
MFEDKGKVDEPDRSRVAAVQEYEVRHLAGKYGLSQDYVRHLIARAIRRAMMSCRGYLCSLALR